MEVSLSRVFRRRALLSGGAAWLIGCLSICGLSPAHGQVEMELELTRRAYILYEPLVATVKITNLAGRDLHFEDMEGKQWFNVEVTTGDGTLLLPYDPDYKLQPLDVPAGRTVTRKIDLATLFPIREQGQHRLRANVYLADTDKFFSSNYATFDLTDGQPIWRETVGVPGSTELRDASLLTFQRPDRLELYARIRGEGGTMVYTTQGIGRMVMGGQDPQVMFDRQNTMHILHETMPSTFFYTEIGINGERLNQKVYTRNGNSRPRLIKTGDGDVAVQGGQVQVASAQAVGPNRPQGPKLSDRPVGLPRPAPTPGG